MKKEFKVSDSTAIKGVAILLLLFHHLFFKMEANKDIGVAFLTNERILRIAIFSKICVSIFAFITGYGLTKSFMKSQENVENWLPQRVKRNITSCWYAVALSMIIPEIIEHKASRFYFDGEFTHGLIRLCSTYLCLDRVLHHRLYNGSWWYLSALLIFTLMIPVFYFLVKKLGVSTSILIVVIAPRIISNGDGGKATNAISFFMPLLFGVIFAYYDLFVKLNNYNQIVEAIILAILVVVSYKLYLQLVDSNYWEIYWGIIPTVVIVFLYRCIVWIPILTNVLQFIGKHSLSIFLTHAYIRADYMHDYIYARDNFIEMFVITLLASLLLAFLVDKSNELLKKGIKALSTSVKKSK